MDMSELEFPDDSFDVAFAMFSIYHTNPLVALKELKRVTKPGGKVVIATSGPLNKLQHRRFEKESAQWMTHKIHQDFLAANPDMHGARKALELGKRTIKPPRHMNAVFDSRIAQVTLPIIFNVYKHFPPSDGMLPFRWIEITPETADVYYWSHFTMLSSYNPPPPIGLLREAVDAVVKPELEAAFAANGIFRDIAQRDIFFCLNDKKATKNSAES